MAKMNQKSYKSRTFSDPDMRSRHANQIVFGPLYNANKKFLLKENNIY